MISKREWLGIGDKKNRKFTYHLAIVFIMNYDLVLIPVNGPKLGVHFKELDTVADAKLIKDQEDLLRVAA